MEPKAQFVFFLLAFICFVVEAIKLRFPADAQGNHHVDFGLNLIAAGLAFVDFVWMYNAYKAA